MSESTTSSSSYIVKEKSPDNGQDTDNDISANEIENIEPEQESDFRYFESDFKLYTTF